MTPDFFCSSDRLARHDWLRPLRSGRRSFGRAVILASVFAPALWAQGYPPAQAVERMTVAPGFQVKVVAHEPMMAQPVCIEFDDRGRLWVVQYLQYPNPAGLKRVKVDRYSRTVYDKVPEPPPLGPRGADRVTILEDTDGDGVADRGRDFVDGLNLATSAVFGYGGVFVMQAPYLLFYPDRDENDVPDAAPEVLLSGFGIEDAQSFANSLIWGPDGWLYGCQGSTVTAKVRGLEFQQAIWRYHPVNRRFELFSEGGGNMWGLDYDRDGNLLASTNGGGGTPAANTEAPPPFPGKYVSYRMIHMVQGAYYAKSFAKHGELHNPYAYGYFDRVPGQAYKGFHVTPGGTVYQGDSFPAEFRGRFIANDLLGHGVQWNTMAPWGTTFKTTYGGDMLNANDTWFAPSDMTTGPDGAVYVADWTDQRMSHPDPDAEWDRSNGRVYRIQWGAAAAKSAAGAMGTVLQGASSLTKLSSEALIKLLGHQNDWFVRRARRILTERRDAAAYPRLRELVGAGEDTQLGLEAFWALYGGGGCDEAYLRSLLKHPSPRVRRWAVRFLGDQEKVGASAETALIELATTETDANARSQLASTAARLGPAAGLRVAQKLILQNRDATDPHIPLLIWWAVERHCVAAVELASELFNTPAVWASTLAQNSVLPRLLRRYAAEGTGPALQACAALLGSLPLGVEPGRFVVAFEQGIRTPALNQRTWRLEEMPPALARQLSSRWQDGTRDESLIRLLAWLGYVPARNRAFALATDRDNVPTTRAMAVRVLGDPARAKDTSQFLRWFAGDEPDEVKLAALEALQQFDSGEIALELLREYPKLNSHLQTKVRAALLSRRTGAQTLLEQIDSRKIRATDVSQGELRQIEQFADKRLDALVRKYWGKVNTTPEDKLAVVRRFRNDLSTMRDKPPGDPARGHQLYLQTCAACHTLFGEGGKLGPDLTPANRKDNEFLLTSIVDPSAVIRKEFLNYTIKTNDGRVLNGSVAEGTAGNLSIMSATGERTEIPRAKITSMEDSGISLMPEGLLETLTPQGLRDLFAYIQSDVRPRNSP